jgi:hypothetical protein
MLSKFIVGISMVLIGCVLMFANPLSNKITDQHDLDQKILGKWTSENDAKSQWIFMPEGVLRPLYDGAILTERHWEFTEECDGAQVLEGDYGLLKITSTSGIYNCYVVQGLESVLTLLRIPEGNLLIYDRVVE